MKRHEQRKAYYQAYYRANKVRLAAYNKIYGAAWYKANKEKVKIAGRLRYIANAEKIKQQARADHANNPDRQYKRTLLRIGWTYDGYLEQVKRQHNKCAICKCGPKSRIGRLHADHSHVTGKRRGLLCRACNLALGGFLDCPERLRAAIEYLRRWDGKNNHGLDSK